MDSRRLPVSPWLMLALVAAGLGLGWVVAVAVERAGSADGRGSVPPGALATPSPTTPDTVPSASGGAGPAPASSDTTESPGTFPATPPPESLEPTTSPWSPSAWPAAGAGPDCGGPESYQPPRDEDDDRPPFFTSVPDEEGDGSNGSIPRSAMAPLDWCTDSRGNEQWLRADAAAALTALNEEFRAEFGENIAVDLSYRSLADQFAIRETYGSLAARPGTSNHGWGTAFDTWEWEAYDFGSPRYLWLVENGPRFGWHAPAWAREDGSKPEYWHFEFTG